VTVGDQWVNMPGHRGFGRRCTWCEVISEWTGGGIPSIESWPNNLRLKENSMQTQSNRDTICAQLSLTLSSQPRVKLRSS